MELYLYYSTFKLEGFYMERFFVLSLTLPVQTDIPHSKVRTGFIALSVLLVHFSYFELASQSSLAL